jgi:hypothetical protein
MESMNFWLGNCVNIILASLDFFFESNQFGGILIGQLRN